MKGSQSVQVSNRHTKYKFVINRNITLVSGDSGTGKTTLYDMIAEHDRYGDASGVQLASSCPCVALTDADWQNQLNHTSGSIVFIDEGAAYISSYDFATAIQATDNYYVIFSRENLHELPYSVDEIYVIKTSGKMHTFQKKYKSQEGRIYTLGKSNAGKMANTILTEDSHCGYQLYCQLYDGSSVKCETSNSNAAIFSWLKNHLDQKIFVIADGAAFGSQMDRVMLMQRQYPDRITVCLPESFEWLILQSGLIDIPGLSDMLANPGTQVESSKHSSWEQFFTDYLVQNTTGTYMAYSKSKSSSFYFVRENMERIVALIAINMPEWNR